MNPGFSTIRARYDTDDVEYEGSPYALWLDLVDTVTVLGISSNSCVEKLTY